MLGALAVVSILRGAYDEYSDWRTRRDRLTRQAPFQQLSIPRTEEGTSPTLVYGRCLVRAPVCSFIGTVEATDISGVTENGITWPEGTFSYGAQMFFAIGFPFGGGVQKIHAIYNGEKPFEYIGSGNQLSDLVGGGSFETGATVSIDGSWHVSIGGSVEFLNGNSTQELVDSGGSATTVTGERMIAEGLDPSLIPGYRGYLGAFLYRISGGFHLPDKGWGFGTSPEMPAFSFEVSSYPFAQGYTAFIPTRIGDEANPADVIWDLLTGTYGKLGISPDLLHAESFRRAGETLLAENHGYSRAVEDGATAHDIIREVLDQIDGVLFDDPSTGLIKIKLIRADYDPNTVLKLSPSNCKSVDNFVLRGVAGLPNKIRITYTSRQVDYQPRTATAQNIANAVGQDGLVNELQIDMLGICTEDLAEEVAARELAIASRPLMTCTVTMSREGIELLPGDVVSLTWPDYKLSNVIFRVGKPNRGKPTDNNVVLDLVQDYFYVHRKRVHPGGDVTPFPTPPILDPDA